MSAIPTVDWPRMADCTEDVGLWCWGCARRICRKGAQPTRWIEVLCGEPDCPAWAIAGAEIATLVPEEDDDGS